MDYKITIEANKPCDVCVRVHEGKLLATILEDNGFQNKILEQSSSDEEWAVLFTNVNSPTGVLWITVQNGLVAVNGLFGTRISPDDRLLLAVDTCKLSI